VAAKKTAVKKAVAAKTKALFKKPAERPEELDLGQDIHSY